MKSGHAFIRIWYPTPSGRFHKVIYREYVQLYLRYGWRIG